MTEIIKSNQGSTLSEQVEYAQLLADSNLLPKSFQKQPANVLMAIEFGNSLGLTPIMAMQEITVIQGKPTASANLIGALVRKAGHRLRVKVDSQQLVAVAQIVRKDDPEFTYEARWDMDRAKRAGLTGKDNWKNYSEAMLKARSITEVAREACPEALMGVDYTPEEIQDTPNRPITIDPAVTGEVVKDAGATDTLSILAETTTIEEMNVLWNGLDPQSQANMQAKFDAHAKKIGGQSE